jgi:nicotinate-nucleotide--dimethylbenzimidazole phosphoribosyltransferase
MVRTYVAGGAAINALAGWAGADVVVVDAGLASGPDVSGAAAQLRERPIRRGGTDDMAAGPAMRHEEAVAAVEAGLWLAEDLASDGVRAIGVGEMGIGNTTAASAIAAVMTGRRVAQVTGPGAGLDERGLARKIELVELALAVNRPDRRDPLGLLAAVGGFEIGMLSGLILGAAAARVPVVLDGFITAAAAAVAAGLAPALPGRLVASHRSSEPGHGALLAHLRLHPLLDLSLRLGEGTGAALGLALLDAACRARDEMATFEAAGVAARLET